MPRSSSILEQETASLIARGLTPEAARLRRRGGGLGRAARGQTWNASRRGKRGPG
jgi:hypothetical protein